MSPERLPFRPLAIIEQQPFFPLTDLSRDNAEVIPYLLVSDGSILERARHLEHYQRNLYELAHHALIASYRNPVNSPNEYRSFTQGFSSLEAMALLVRPPERAASFSARNAHKLFASHNHLADIQLSERMAKWPQKFPRTFDAVVSIGDSQGETMGELNARVAGAQIAFELMHPDIESSLS